MRFVKHAVHLAALASLLLSSVSAAQAQAWWRPVVATSWQWQLRGVVNTGYEVKVYNIDLFETPQATINQIKAAGRHVVCYFSAGSSEAWRPDFLRFQAADMGSLLDGWPGERWLDTRSPNVRAVMLSRLDLARSKGCDGVQPDNVDGAINSPGFPLTASTQLDYNRFLAAAAHARGMAVGLQNDIDQISALEPLFDFAVNEQCNQHRECGGYSAFIGKNKPVFNAEYASKYRKNKHGARDRLCQAMSAATISTLVLPLQLDDSDRYSCL